MKLATFAYRGQEKVGIVHSGDGLLFDLAAASNRTETENPAFASMLALIDATPDKLSVTGTVSCPTGRVVGGGLPLAGGASDPERAPNTGGVLSTLTVHVEGVAVFPATSVALAM